MFCESTTKVASSSKPLCYPTPLTTTEVLVDGGKWVFVGWNEDSITVGNSNIMFTGTWIFIENTIPTPTKKPKELKRIKDKVRIIPIYADGSTVPTTGDISDYIGYMILGLMSLLFGSVVVKKKYE